VNALYRRYDSMIRYHSRRLMGAVVGGLGGALFGSILGLIVVVAWREFLAGRLDWPIDQLLGLTSSMAVPLGLFLVGCSRCAVVEVQEDGLAIRSCFFWWFFVPWRNVTWLWSGRLFSPMDPWFGHRAFVLIKQGLTPLHSGLVKGPQGWQWSRCFMMTSDGKGYSEVVQAIEEHIADYDTSEASPQTDEPGRSG